MRPAAIRSPRRKLRRTAKPPPARGPSVLPTFRLHRPNGGEGGPAAPFPAWQAGCATPPPRFRTRTATPPSTPATYSRYAHSRSLPAAMVCSVPAGLPSEPLCFGISRCAHVLARCRASGAYIHPSEQNRKTNPKMDTKENITEYTAICAVNLPSPPIFLTST